MGYVILCRNPADDRVVAINEARSGNSIAVFATEDEASEAAAKIPLCQAWPYAVVEAP